MMTFMDWFEREYNEKYPDGDIPADWFFDHGLPMIVECAGCGMTMAIPSVMVSKDEYLYCHNCADIKDENISEDFDNCDDECGFDPYEGCYTFDC